MPKTVKSRDILRKRRNQRKMPQIVVATNVGISQALYSLIERGYSKPDEEVAASLCEMFDLAPDYFEQGEGEQKGA